MHEAAQREGVRQHTPATGGAFIPRLRGFRTPRSISDLSSVTIPVSADFALISVYEVDRTGTAFAIGTKRTVKGKLPAASRAIVRQSYPLFGKQSPLYSKKNRTFFAAITLLTPPVANPVDARCPWTPEPFMTKTQRSYAHGESRN
jgi:hypothetical protein